MFPSVTVSPTVVPIDFNNVALDSVLDTLSVLVKFDPEVIKKAQNSQPLLPLWDIIDVGNIANRYGDFEMMSVVYSPAMMGEIYVIHSDEIMFAVLDFIKTTHALRYKTTLPLTWDVAEQYQTGYEDYEHLDDLQDAFYRWDAQRQKSLIESELPQKTLSKKKQKI